MKDFVKQWNEASPVVLPIRIDKFNYTIEQIHVNCPQCHGELNNLRGKVYEVFDCVEADVVGICMTCKLAVGHRSRYYPATGRCIMDGVNGWKEGVMVSPFVDRIINFFHWIVMKINFLKKFIQKQG